MTHPVLNSSSCSTWKVLSAFPSFLINKLITHLKLLSRSGFGAVDFVLVRFQLSWLSLYVASGGLDAYYNFNLYLFIFTFSIKTETDLYLFFLFLLLAVTNNIIILTISSALLHVMSLNTKPRNKIWTSSHLISWMQQHTPLEKMWFSRSLTTASLSFPYITSINQSNYIHTHTIFADKKAIYNHKTKRTMDRRRT